MFYIYIYIYISTLKVEAQEVGKEVRGSYIYIYI